MPEEGTGNVSQPFAEENPANYIHLYWPKATYVSSDNDGCYNKLDQVIVQSKGTIDFRFYMGKGMKNFNADNFILSSLPLIKIYNGINDFSEAIPVSFRGISTAVPPY